MSTKPPEKRSNTLDRVRKHLEHLRLDAREAEAMAIGARDHLERITYLPRSRHITEEEAKEIRREFGRVHAYVFAAAEATGTVLDGIERALDMANADDDDGGNDNGGNGGGQDPDLSPDDDDGDGDDHDNSPAHPTEAVHSPLQSRRSCPVQSPAAVS